MPKPRKNVAYNASSETIRSFFERSMALREEQKDVSKLISSLNSEMEASGVHPGIVSIMRRFAALPEGKRGFAVAIARFYLEILEDLLADDQIDVNDLIRKAKEREMESVAPPPSGNGADDAKAKLGKGDAKGALKAAQEHLSSGAGGSLEVFQSEE